MMAGNTLGKKPLLMTNHQNHQCFMPSNYIVSAIDGLYCVMVVILNIFSVDDALSYEQYNIQDYLVIKPHLLKSCISARIHWLQF